MSNRWDAVDAYFVDQLLPEDPAMDAALRRADEGGLPAIQVAPNQGRLLELLARMVGAKRILEIGTLGGYSTIWLARALPEEGRLITLELDLHPAEVARANIAGAGFAGKVEGVTGPAADSLIRLIASGEPAFDFVFLDADKGGYPTYLRHALTLARPGSVIVADNVVRDGKVIDKSSSDASVRGARAFIAAVAQEPRLLATAIQTVGSKGYDGFAIALVIK
jgi:predicted O-methyltransferase YrrM